MIRFKNLFKIDRINGQIVCKLTYWDNVVYFFSLVLDTEAAILSRSHVLGELSTSLQLKIQWIFNFSSSA